VTELYDTLGVGYADKRRPDPRIERAIHAALGDARSVVNVGAGAGSYEPRDREVVAIEPSEVMRAQRPSGLVEAIDASAEELPLADGSVDAAMAVLTDHHWSDRPRALREMRRVARKRVVLFTFDPALGDLYWMNRDYLPQFHDLVPEAHRAPGRWEAELRELLGPGVRVEPVMVPHDCIDGFYGAYWRRPEAFLDPAVRQAISVFSLVNRKEVAAAVERLRGDLVSGRWAEVNARIVSLEELDLGYRLVRAELL
jgi:SAM-dependent methyltransferase